MLFLKQATILLLIVVSTRSFSQQLISEKFQSGNNESKISENTDLTFQNDKKSDNLLDSPLDEMHDNSSVMNKEGDITDIHDTAVPIEFLGPELDTKFKRGNMIEVRWSGGNPGDEYSLDLFDGRFHYRHIGELKNSGIYPWIIPMDVAPGKEYKFKLTNTEDFGEYAFSKSFIIKRRMPVAAWIVPGAIVVGGGLFLLFYDNSNELPDLPRPIEPN